MTTIPTSHAERAAIEAVPARLLIDGRWREAERGGTFEVEDPALGEPIGRVADATGADALMALEAAARAQARWARTPPRERADILRRAFEEVLARADELALVMTLEMGKPLVMAAREVAPALAAGCTIILKPARLTPYSTLALADILQRAGVPAGVANVITAASSADVTTPLIEDPRLRLLTFTGSDEVAGS